MSYIVGYLNQARRLFPGWLVFIVIVIVCLLSSGTTEGFEITDSSVIISWTATGDDGYLGRASYYDLRFIPVGSDSVGLSPENWYLADTIPLGRPSYSGETDMAKIHGLLPSTTYDIAILIGDEVPNWSGISNILRVTTKPKLAVSVPDSAEAVKPHKFQLNQNYPNPFNPTTVISFEIGKTQIVRIDVFNILGQEVNKLVDSRMSAGPHQVTWNGRDNSGRPAVSGIYFYRIRAGEFVQTRKMVLLR